MFSIRSNTSFLPPDDRAGLDLSGFRCRTSGDVRGLVHCLPTKSPVASEEKP